MERNSLPKNRLKTYGILAVIAIGFLLYVARPWQDNSSPPIQQSSSTAPTLTQRPTPIKETPAYQSKGLGLARGNWEASHTPTGDGAVGPEYDGNIEIMLDEQDRIHHMERIFRPGIAAVEVKKIGESFIPEDSKFIKTYTPEGRPEMTVHVYRSESLAQRFDEQWFFSSSPGTFIIFYNKYDGMVDRLVIATGDNP